MVSKSPAETSSAGGRAEPSGAREIDLTWWLAVGGLGLFLLMLIGAVAVYTVTQVAQVSATETAAVALAATATAPATATALPASPTITPTPLGGLVLADTPTRAPSPTRSPSPTVTHTPSISPTPTVTLTPTRPPPTLTPTPVGTPTPVVYIVRDGDTLGAIATVYGLTIDELLAANAEIENPDRLVVGQTLLIPIAVTSAPPTPGQVTAAASTPAEPAAAGLPRSILDGDLAAGYPLTAAGSRITLHYQPGSFAEIAGPQTVLDHAEQALAGVERTLDVSYSDRIDIYLAGSLFAAPNQGVRQRHFPAQRRVFILYDGSGTPAERRAMLAHEITQVVAWHAYGVPAAVMLSEGLATYVGQPYLEEGGFIGFRDFCRALARTNRLPSLLVVENSVQGFQDPVRNLYNYRAAGCFVADLFEQGGSAAFARLYPTGDYAALYGSSLVSLDDDFSLALGSGAFQIGFDPERLVSYYDEVNAGYATLFARPDPDVTAYQTLDDARIATLSGNFDGARALLDQFHLLIR